MTFNDADENLKIWNAGRQPDGNALQRITGGRLNGMTSINPQWRLGKLTQMFGPVGIGWNYDITRTWSEPGADDQTVVFVEVALRYKWHGEWSEPVTGLGGGMLVTKEKRGMHTSDDCYKMALTDAISVACKAMGLAADIYFNRWDGDKYTVPAPSKQGRADKKPTKTMQDALHTQLLSVFSASEDIARFLMENGQNVARSGSGWDIEGAIAAIPDKGSIDIFMDQLQQIIQEGNNG